MARVKDFARIVVCRKCSSGEIKAMEEEWTCGCVLRKGCNCRKNEDGLAIEHGCGQPGHPKDHPDKE